VSLTAVPAPNYQFVSWSGDATGSTNPVNVTMNANRSVTATFALQTFTVSVSAAGNGSVAKSPNQASYPYGTVVTVTPTPDPGNSFVSWGGDTSGTANPLTVVVTRNRTIVGNFTYTLTTSVTPVGSGTITRNPNQTSYTPGTVVALTAVPANGYSFVSWSGDATGSTNPVNVTMSANRNVTATFALNQYTLSVTTAGNGSVAKNPNQATYPHGTVVTLTATPDAGNGFVSWGGDTSGTTNPLTVVMTRNRTIVGNFTYTLATTVSPVGGGSVTKSPNQPNYNPGTVVSLTAVPAVGYHFVSWSGDATGSTNPVNVTMSANRSVTATFVLNQYTLTIPASTGGTVTKNPNQATYAHGTVVTLTPVPSTGYHFVSWGGDASGSLSPLNVTMDSDKNITAAFGLDTFTVAVSVVGNGTAARNPSLSSYPYGTSVTLTGTPDAGNAFVSWSGDTSTTTNPLSIVVTRNRALTANFTFTLATSVTPAGSGSITRSPNQTNYAPGTVVALTAVPGTGYSFVSWSGDATGSANPVNVTMSANRSVTATFALNQYTLSVSATGNGSVVKSPNQATYAHGTVVTLTPTPDPNNGFVSWGGDTSGTANPMTVVMTRNRTIVGSFTYTLTATGGTGGSVTRNPDQPSYTPGAVVSLTAVPTTGYHFASWSGDATGSVNPLNVTVDGNKVITASFALDVFTVTVNATGNGTVARSPSQASYPYGSVVSITATPDPGNAFVSWGGDTSGTANPLTVVVTRNRSITGSFTFTLATAVNGSGSIAKSPDQPNYVPGSVVSLTANPGTGYHFVSWSGDATGSANPVNVTMNANRSVTATFAPDDLTLTVSSVGNGSVGRSPSQATYPYGTVVTVTATPDPNNGFVSWGGDTSGTANPLTVVMTRNRTIVGNFTYTLTTSAGTGGSVTKGPDQPNYAPGSTVTLTAVPSAGYQFVSWGGDLSGSTNPVNLIMNGNKSVTATFTASQFTLDVSHVPANGGSVSKSPDQPTYPYGASVTITAASAAGYHFVGWSGDTTGSTNPVAVPMIRNKVITANFVADNLADGIVVSQVYGGGGNAGSPYQNDYIELFNRGNRVVDVTGWSVQYAPATGGTWSTTTLVGTIPGGGYYLVQEAAGAGGGAALPTPDAIGTITMNPISGKVVIVKSPIALIGSCSTDTTIADWLGYGSADCAEVTPAPALSNSTAEFRADGGCTDTDNNSSDFAVGIPTPHNSASAPNYCPQWLAASDPAVVDFALGPPIPNPSRGALRVELSLPRASAVRLEMMDVQGREVARLADGTFTAGRHEVTWSGFGAGQPRRSGVYFLRLHVSGKTLVRTVILTQ
jgi:uncharacterized repeat protein (TIGR02543 family)